MKAKKIIYVLFLIISILLGASCGTRKTQQTKTDLNTKEVTTDNSTTEINTDSNTKVIDCTFTDEVEIIPIDNTREIVVNGKKYFNTRLKYKKTKNNVVTDKVEKVSKKQQNNVKTKKKVSLEVKKKDTESKRDIILSYWWLWLLIILLGYGVYKYKIWFI